MDERFNIDSLYSNKLDINCFSQMLQNPTQGYKFYWLEAIMTILWHEKKNIISFKEIVYEMLWESWFTITKYHLRLGPTIEGKAENYIEHVIHVIEKDDELKNPLKKEYFYYLLDKNHELIKDDIGKLTRYVPVRLISAFLPGVPDTKLETSPYIMRIMADIETVPPYIIQKEKRSYYICVHNEWMQFMLDNYVLIINWIQMEKVRYLQKRNPGVPGLIYKLEDNDATARDLQAVSDLWKTYRSVTGKPIIDIYSEKALTDDTLSIDHFVPWSYVTDNELWNLTPMDKRANSSKSNRLPIWDRYFTKFVKAQFLLYKFINDKSQPIAMKCFISCKDAHLNEVWAAKLYDAGKSEEEFGNMLESHMKPLYDSAKSQGYKIWRNEFKCID